MSEQMVKCSGCGNRYKAGGNLAGKQVRCRCGKTLTVPDNFLDEVFGDTGRKTKPPVQVQVVEPDRSADQPPVVPAMLAARQEREEEPETVWDRFRSPSREWIAWLAVGYGAAMACLLLALAVWAGAMLYPFSELSLLFFVSIRAFWIAVAVLIAVGGILIRKRHPLGPPCAGMACLATAFSWIWSLLWAFFPIYIFVPIFAVEFVFIYSIPAYVIYWCLKEEEAAEEAARQNDLYALRDAMKERRIEENQRRWKSKES